MRSPPRRGAVGGPPARRSDRAAVAGGEGPPRSRLRPRGPRERVAGRRSRRGCDHGVHGGVALRRRVSAGLLRPRPRLSADPALARGGRVVPDDGAARARSGRRAVQPRPRAVRPRRAGGGAQRAAARGRSRTRGHGDPGRRCSRCSRPSSPPTRRASPRASAATSPASRCPRCWSSCACRRRPARWSSPPGAAPAIVRLVRGQVTSASAPGVKRLGETLIERGIITAAALDAALAKQRLDDGEGAEALGALLLRERPANRDALTRAVFQQVIDCAGRDAELEGGRVLLPSRERQGAAGHRVRPAERDAGNHAFSRREQRNRSSTRGGPMTADRQSPKHSLIERRVSICSAGIAMVATLVAAAPARAQEERVSAPSLPDAAGEDVAPPAAQDRLQTLEDRIAELGDRLRESEEARQKSVSPMSWNGYVDFGFFVPLGQRRRRLGARRRQRPVPAVLGLFVDVPRRHPGAPRSTPAARWRTSATRRTRHRFDSVNSRRRRQLHRQRDQPAAPLPARPSARSCAPASTSCPAPARTSRSATSSTSTWPSSSAC